MTGLSIVLVMPAVALAGETFVMTNSLGSPSGKNPVPVNVTLFAAVFKAPVGMLDGVGPLMMCKLFTMKERVCVLQVVTPFSI